MQTYTCHKNINKSKELINAKFGRVGTTTGKGWA